MWRNDLINIKWLLLYFVFSIVFGRYVPEFEAIEVARNIYIEHADLHGGDEWAKLKKDTQTAIVRIEKVIGD